MEDLLYKAAVEYQKIRNATYDIKIGNIKSFLKCKPSPLPVFMKGNMENDFYEKITEIFWFQTQRRCGKEFTEKLVMVAMG